MKQTDPTARTGRVLTTVVLAVLWLAGAEGGWAADALEMQPRLAYRLFGRADGAGRQGAWDGSNAAPNSPIAPEIYSRTNFLRLRFGQEGISSVLMGLAGVNSLRRSTLRAGA